MAISGASDTLRQYLRGWTEYYRLADMGTKVKEIDRLLPPHPHVYMEIVETL